MTSRTDSHVKSLIFSQPIAAQQHCFFKNHQKWQISRHLDCTTGSPIFYLIDSYGISHALSEFIVEDLASDFGHTLYQLRTLEEQQQYICQYLQKRLDQATPHQVHIDRYGNQLAIRFGDYGLKGGGRIIALILSTGQVGVGVALVTTGVGAIAGGTLISSGLAGGAYAYQHTNDYNDKEYVKQTGYGGVTGLVAGGVTGTAAQGAGLLAKVGYQALGGVAGSVASTTTEAIVEQKVPKGTEVIKKVCSAGIAGGVGTLAGQAVGSVMNRVMTEVSEDATAIAIEALKKGCEGSASSVSGKIASNWCEGKENKVDEITEAAVVGFAIGGAIGGGNQMKKIQELNRTNNQIRQASNQIMRGRLGGLEMAREISHGIACGQPPFLEAETPTSMQKEQMTIIIQDERQRFNIFCQQLAAKNGLHFIPSKHPNRIANGDIRPEPVSFVGTDQELQELIPHVILVQAVTYDVISHFIESYDFVRGEIDEVYKPLFCMKKILTPQGVVGHHLELEKQEFQGEFRQRPHTHWSWNQLVQPNGTILSSGLPMNYWEDAPIAMFEPLSTFENSICHKPFGVAPYDTFVFGPHRLSDKSILLVPEYLEAEARSHLAAFGGKIVTYNPSEKSLRSAVIDTLQTHYPETWHICDENGKLIGKESRYSATGYSSKTCLKRTNGTVLPLIQGEGYNSADQISTEMKKYSSTKRFIGLHANAPTDKLENEKNVYFQSIKNFTTNNATVRNNSRFAGGIRHDINALTQWSTLKALKFYNKLLLKYDLKTGSRDVARYVLNTAMHADLASLFYQEYPFDSFDLSALDLNMIFKSDPEYFRMLLNDIATDLKAGDLNSKQKALGSFNMYCSVLKDSLKDLRDAKEQIVLFRKKMVDEGLDTQVKPLCLTVGLDEWQNIDVPSNIEFDLGRNWPHSEKLYAYVYKVLRTLPTEVEKLKTLYQQISILSHQGEDRKEQYRLNIICSSIQYVIQEKIYLTSRNDNVTSILANKLSKQAGWLTEYGLETEDYTQKLGDCLFDNVAAQLPAGIAVSQQLRRDIAQFMWKHSEGYAEKPDYKEKELQYAEGTKSVTFNNWKEYIECVGTSEVWVTELEVQALASFLDCPIVLMEIGVKPRIYNLDSTKDPIFLHHINSNHFESCLPLKGLNVNDVYHNIKSRERR